MTPFAVGGSIVRVIVVVLVMFCTPVAPHGVSTASWSLTSLCTIAPAPYNDQFAAPVPVDASCCPGNASGGRCAVVACMDGTIAAVDVDAGAVLWSRRLPSGHGVRGTPAVSRDVLVASTLGQRIVAFDVRDGSILWEWQGPKPSWVFDVTIDAATQVVTAAFRDGPTVVLSVSSGMPLCHFPTDGVWGPALLRLSTPRPVFAVAMTASVLITGAIDFDASPCLPPSKVRPPRDNASLSRHTVGLGVRMQLGWQSDVAPTIRGKARWRYWIFSGPVITPDDRCIVAAGVDGWLHAVDSATGRIEWMTEVAPRAGSITAPLVARGTSLYGATEAGVLFEVFRAPENGTWMRRWSCRLPDAGGRAGAVLVPRSGSLYGAFAPSGGGLAKIIRCAAAADDNPVVVAVLPAGCRPRSLGCHGCTEGALKLPTLIVGCQNASFVAVVLEDEVPETVRPLSFSTTAGPIASHESQGGLDATGSWFATRVNDVVLGLLAVGALYCVAWRRAVQRARQAHSAR